jgi:serine phosphatase RsbU (regulator of sigma subunit)
LSALENWLAHEHQPQPAAAFFSEAERFRRSLSDPFYTVIHQRSRTYYYADAATHGKAEPRYTLSPSKPEDGWYFATIHNLAPYTLNVNRDAQLKVTKLWINVQVRNAQGEALGLLSTGIQLTHFLREMLVPRLSAVQTFIVDQRGRIVAHPDPAQIEYGSIDKSASNKTLLAQLVDHASQERALAGLQSARNSPGVITIDLRTRDGRRLAALAHLPDLDWTVVSLVNPATSGIVASDLVRLTTIGAMIALILLVLTVMAMFDRTVLKPLTQLTNWARTITAGRYDIRLQSRRKDEIGDLSNAFDTMAAQIESHTQHLEQLVAERTAQLESTHAELVSTHDRLTESICYASLIQKVILPDQNLAQHWWGQYFAVWQPRDVVGGDLYLYREQGDKCLFGVIDCAGHGVPGAFMTMIAHAALERATSEDQWDSPAVLLERVDAAVRQMLPATDRLEHLATSMDIGLCYVDWSAQQVQFAGAKIDLFVHHPGQITHIKGSRGGINDRKPRRFESHQLALAEGTTFYLVTDGILDQAGGEKGLPFGRRGFLAWLEQHATTPLEQQKIALINVLSAYQGTHPQRDDITVLAFRFESTSAPQGA